MSYIADDIGAVIQLVRGEVLFDESFDPSFSGLVPFYMFGHRRYINGKLLEKNESKIHKYKKYPLIALRLDVDEDIENGMIKYPSLNLAILAYTKVDYTIEQRLENVYYPVLKPLYDLFFEKLKESGLFTWPGRQDFPPHKRIFRPYWGTYASNDEGTDKSVFSDPLDAIEILNLKINQVNNKC